MAFRAIERRDCVVGNVWNVAPFHIKRQVADAAGVPIGEVRGWGCTSQAAAERAADEQETAVRTNYITTTTTKTSVAQANANASSTAA